MLFQIIITLFAYMSLFFVLALWKKNFTLVDIGWGLGFIIIAIISYLHYPLFLKNTLLLVVVSAWGLRLSYYLFLRTIGKKEDDRYTQLRKRWGESANKIAYFRIFMLQGALMFIVSLPIPFGMMQQSGEMYFYNWIGLIIWCLGWMLEVVSDFHLNRFKSKKENMGKICTSGPWKLCRFPNYFGEILLWYGIYILSLGKQSWWTIIGPISINLFILKVSGVSLLEKKYKKNAEYLSYSEKIPRLIPFTKPKKLAK